MDIQNTERFNPEWSIESLRLTLFASGAPTADPASVWQSVMGVQPDNRITRPKENLHQDDATIDGIKFVMSSQPTRTDWFAESANTLEGTEHVSTRDMLGSYVALMRRWIVTSPAIPRMAFGAVLVHPVPDQRIGNVFLAKYLPNLKVEASEISDLIYQVNRIRDSRTGLKDLKVNRLAKWSVMSLTKLNIGHNPPSLDTTNVRNICRLELDINTIAEYRPNLPANRLQDILNELVAFGVEISTLGDIS